MEAPVIEAASKPESEVDENLLERKKFREHLERNRTKQLESLEQKLAGFACFSREQEIKRQAPSRHPRVGRASNTLKSIENISEDVANNNVEGGGFTQSPSFVTGVMRQYQLEGLNWLVSLYHNGLSGILADEMGLGKTLQSISMIGYLMHVRKLKGPFLVIVPLSTIDNWLKEFAKFLPSAKILKAHALGDEKLAMVAKLRQKKPSWNVAVATYEILVRHGAQFERLNFHYAIIDEGHRAKNENTLFPAVLRRCNIQGMVLLTGTPIHNNLHELWALLNLLMPLFFNSAANFDSWFKVEDCLDPLHEQTRRLQNLLKPLMLRRIKSEVCPDIPPKVRITLCVPPTEEICVWTTKLLENDVTVQQPDGTCKPMRMGNVFPFLRKVALHPFLIPGAEPLDDNHQVTEQIVEHSAKMIVLDKLLTRLKQRHSKVLIFSQYVEMLHILTDYFDWKGYTYCLLHGTTSGEERQEQIEEFTRAGSDKFIFGLSTRAGGLGINLVAADAVIFYDMDFNPQMDLQAEDRAHRIGQRKKVHVFRLIVRGTCEESLHAIAERKKQLDESVIRSNLSRAIQQEATEHSHNNLMSEGTIDRVALDDRLDAVFRAMDTAEGLQGDHTVILPAIPREVAHDVRSPSRRFVRKRKPEDDLIVTGKRVRRQVYKVQ